MSPAQPKHTPVTNLSRAEPVWLSSNSQEPMKSAQACLVMSNVINYQMWIGGGLSFCCMFIKSTCRGQNESMLIWNKNHNITMTPLFLRGKKTQKDSPMSFLLSFLLHAANINRCLRQKTIKNEDKRIHLKLLRFHYQREDLKWVNIGCSGQI